MDIIRQKFFINDPTLDMIEIKSTILSTGMPANDNLNLLPQDSVFLI